MKVKKKKLISIFSASLTLSLLIPITLLADCKQITVQDNPSDPSAVHNEKHCYEKMDDFVQDCKYGGLFNNQTAACTSAMKTCEFETKVCVLQGCTNLGNNEFDCSYGPYQGCLNLAKSHVQEISKACAIDLSPQQANNPIYMWPAQQSLGPQVYYPIQAVPPAQNNPTPPAPNTPNSPLTPPVPGTPPAPGGNQPAPTPTPTPTLTPDAVDAKGQNNTDSVLNNEDSSSTNTKTTQGPATSCSLLIGNYDFGLSLLTLLIPMLGMIFRRIMKK